MLWKIDGTPHRVLGSVHVLPESFVLPKWAEECHFGMERFVFESDYRNPAPAMVGVDRSGAHLELPGAAGLYSRAAALLAALGSNEPFEALRPWRAALYVVSRLWQHAGVSHAHGMDNRLRLYADGEQLTAEYLESPSRAFDLLDLSCKEAMGGLRFLEKVLAGSLSGSLLTELQNIIRAWSCGDLGALTAIHREKLAQFPVIFDCLITQRNAEWLSPATRLIAEPTPTLFAVGALHTVGPGSFIEHLSGAGFRLVKV